MDSTQAVIIDQAGRAPNRFPANLGISRSGKKYFAPARLNSEDGVVGLDFE